MFKKVLVTGGAGFIGSHTVDLLLARGYEVRVFDNLEPQVHGPSGQVPEYLSRDAEFILGDVRDRAALAKAIDGCDAIIHDAAMVGVGQSQYQPDRYTSVNTFGTSVVLDILINDKPKVERLFVASSMSIYGEGEYKRPSDGAILAPILRTDEQLAAGKYEMLDEQSGEELLPVPTRETKQLYCTSIYALNKKDQEEYCLVAGRAHKMSVVAGRFFNVYGPRQSLSNPYTGVAAIFSSRIKNGNRPLVYEDGHQSRDFIDVRDLAAAKIFLLENPKANLEAFNICTGRATSVLDIGKTLAPLLGRPDIQPQIANSYRSGDTRHCFGDPSRLAALGWKASIRLEDGMRHLVEWCEKAEAVDQVSKAHDELVARGLIRS
jgi:dTDP-L-rhamnose 4-epimerase